MEALRRFRAWATADLGRRLLVYLVLILPICMVLGLVVGRAGALVAPQLFGPPALQAGATGAAVGAGVVWFRSLGRLRRTRRLP